MKTNLWLLGAMMLLLTGCDFTTQEQAVPQNRFNPDGNLITMDTNDADDVFVIGDSVVTNTEASVYEKPKTNATILDVMAAGESGVVTNVRVKGATTWIKVNFENGPNGFVFDYQLDHYNVTPPPPGPPTAAFAYSVNELDVTFDDASTDDGVIDTWLWDFGDGGSSTEQNPSHTYLAEGSYTVTLTVTDNDGETAQASEEVSVSITPPPPVGITLAMAGCSIERNVNEGYQDIKPVDESLLWPRLAVAGYSGLNYGLNGWSNDSGIAMDRFRENVATYGATAIHFMPCIRGPERDGRSEDVPWPVDNELQEARDAIANLKAAAPDLTVYISGQPDYETACFTTGENGSAAMDSLAKVMDAEGLATYGVKLGTLTDDLMVGSRDGCHPGDTGKAFLGNQMRDWVIENL